MKKTKKLVALVIAVVLCSLTINTVSAKTATKTSTDTWKSLGLTTIVVTLSAQGDTTSGKVYDVWFSRLTAYYPFYFGSTSTRSYTIGSTGYAKGQYTWKGGLTTQWIDIPFRTETQTITIIF